jgi:hypothetical protein
MRRLFAEYTNFHDPIGLLRRMIRSRDPAARSALLRAAATVLVTPLDLALVPRERRRLRTAPRSASPLLFIVGAPRSGTTLAYQLLARFLPVSYFTNLTELFPRAPISASRLFHGRLGVPAAGFHSYYGNTAGLSGPNDAFHIWNRWLGSDRYHAPAAIGGAAADEMRRFFDAWLHAFDTPLLTKNNRNTGCIGVLGDALPNASFIEVRRDPLFTTQSLILARERVQGSRFVGWGLASRDSDPNRGAESYIDDVCRQVFDIDMMVQAEKRRLGRHRFVELSYEGLCADPASAVQDVHQRIWRSTLDEDALRFQLRPLPAHNEVMLDRGEVARIEARLAELYGRTGALGA